MTEAQLELPLAFYEQPLAVYESPPETMVREFNRAMQSSSDPELWDTLVAEEAREVREAAAALLKELVDYSYVLIGRQQQTGKRPTLDEHPMLRASEVLTMEIFGPVAAEAFKRVHASNMSKLGPGGVPERRGDGKVLKGDAYVAPDLSDLIERLIHS